MVTTFTLTVESVLALRQEVAKMMQYLGFTVHNLDTPPNIEFFDWDSCKAHANELGMEYTREDHAAYGGSYSPVEHTVFIKLDDEVSDSSLMQNIYHELTHSLQDIEGMKALVANSVGDRYKLESEYEKQAYLIQQFSINGWPAIQAGTLHIEDTEAYVEEKWRSVKQQLEAYMAQQS